MDARAEDRRIRKQVVTLGGRSAAGRELMTADERLKLKKELTAARNR
jgi:hypothetical protein